MDLEAAGRLQRLHGPCEEILKACVEVGDLNCALTVRDKLRDRGLHLDFTSSLNYFFQDFSDGDAVECPPPLIRLASRRTNALFRPEYVVMAGKATGNTNFTGNIDTNKSQPLKGDVSKWQDLPTELLLRITDILGGQATFMAAGVCRDWREGICRGQLELSFSWCGRGVTPLITSFIPRFKSLQVLSFRRCPSFSDEAMETVAKNCHTLKSLDLSMATHLTDKSMEVLASGCGALEMLDLSGCLGIAEEGLVAMASSCSSLKRLNLCGCERAVTDRVMQVLSQSCGYLQSLNLGWCTRITDAGVTALARGCVAIESIDLCGCLLVTDTSVIALANRCAKLRSLGLHCCRLITDRSMHALVSAQLARSSVPLFKPLVVEKKPLSSPSSPPSSGLSSLNLSGCICLHAPAVQAVCDAFPGLHACPEKKSLNVSGCLALTSVRCPCIRDDPHPHLVSNGSPSVITPSNRPL